MIRVLGDWTFFTLFSEQICFPVNSRRNFNSHILLFPIQYFVYVYTHLSTSLTHKKFKVFYVDYICMQNLDVFVTGFRKKILGMYLFI